ncbi:MAG: translation initiation factor IF-2 [Lactococcus raffinolactis]|jgi:translation initiation factor IF-2|uniref:Translation initiation factor IF-2 n=1 Tax=Pseudolactococcus raffinolactis TaxID=1366 RepID=A0A6H0UF95_9LACT|nr:translation initiation factor IF-2 [Lactococcus raffinolactis]MBW9330644.1 translation initiation factor IF-2 [Lactococcus raffinolactis]MDN5414905.1 translation initiation factor IF-2 [Lactococcus raffinolactis]MDN5472653.1 translation initiation factor IF-2 [Lactococcus raffinolactis]MDN5494745.1 translation initiation factor IF-2 [Lactococcus raffinolactis]MDN5579842.1 translation initiation factor IF-2 [Lactococcus raffinolactis]
MSEKKRINQIAKESGLTNKELVDHAQQIGLPVKSHSSSIDAEQAKQLLSSFKAAGNGSSKTQAVKATLKAATEPQTQNRVIVAGGKKVVTETETGNRPIVVGGKKVLSDEEVASGRVISVGGKTVAPTSAPKAETKPTAPAKQNNVAKQSAQPVAEKHAESKSEKKADSKVETKTIAETPKKTERPANGGIKVIKRAEDIKPKNGGIKVIQRAADIAPASQGNANANRNKNKKTRNNNNAQGQGQNSQGGGNRQGGPLRVNDNRNQVRNARNSNWNSNKKKKGKRGGQQVAPQPVVQRKFHELPESLVYSEGMTIADLAKRLKREPAELVKKLFMMGIMTTQNQSLDSDTIELLLLDYGVTPEKKVEEDKTDIERLFIEEGYLNEDELVERPPVVTIMGHVDHGKTTLLDTLRNSRVTSGEAGGITQHIGAYQIEEGGKKITFLDTPGHEAFTSMRARGASVTDITILVVAADDGVMPQTVEAINHSKAAGVPIIVAINKIDKPGANPQRVIQELSEYGVMSQAWGGESEFVEISAKFNTNIDDLLETVLLVAEIQELKADPTVKAIGTVVEARLDKGKGAIATLLVQQGTLHQQDPIVVGNTFGRVRAMVNDLGRREKAAGPSSPVEITGLNDVPQAGDHFAVFEDEKTARSVGEERAKRALLNQRNNTHRVSLENLFDTLKEGQIKSVNVIIKADVQGSAEALAASLQKIEVEGVKVDIVHSAVGAINESDVSLAEAANAVIVGFNVRPTPLARVQAENDAVEIRLHSIIYKVIEEVETAMKGMLDPEFEEKVIGEAVVRETFTVSKVGTIAGFMVLSGSVKRDASVRVIRDGIVIADGNLSSLKHFKDDVKEVRKGNEGGLMIDGYNDIAIDDTFEVYEMVEIKR